MRTIASILLCAGLLATGAARADLDRIRAAAEAGNAEAQLELGILFHYGFNYKDNEVPALTWYMLSAKQGNPRAAELRDTLKAKMSEKDINEAMEQVSQYTPKGTAVPYETLRSPGSAPAPAAPAPPEKPAPPAAPAEATPAQPEATPPPAPEAR